MKAKKIQIKQLDNKLKSYKSVGKVVKPPKGWVNSIRTSLGMSLEQLGSKLKITKQSVQSLEKREDEGTVTIKALEEAAKALEMKFVYGFVPIDGSIEKMIERKAKNLANEIVLRTSGNMKLENQENSPERIRKAIEERTKEIIEEMPKKLWD